MTPEFYRAMADSLEREPPADPSFSILEVFYDEAIYALRRLADKLDEYAAKDKKDEAVR